MVPLPLFVFSAPSTPHWCPGNITRLDRISYCRVSIRLYHHNEPQMCFWCNRFGHSSSNCFAVPQCFKCPGPHLSKDCEKPKEDKPLCCNCVGPHTAKSKSCPAWKAEKEKIVSPVSSHPATQRPLPRPLADQDPKPLQTPAWGGSLQFIPSQIRHQKTTPRTRLAVNLPPCVATPAPAPEKFPAPPVPQPLTPETAAELRIPLRQKRGAIRKKTPGLLNLLLRERVDAEFIQETHLLSWEQWSTPGYQIFRQDRPQLPDQPARRGGGTAVLVADRHITHSILPELKPCDESESAAIDRRLNPTALDNVLAPNLPSIPAGDFNAKHADWGSCINNASGKRLLRWATNHSIGLIAPRDATHFTAKGSGDILDLIILSRLPPPTAVYTIPALSSDHLPVITQFGLAPRTIPDSPRRVFGKADWKQLQEYLTVHLPPPPSILSTPDAVDGAVTHLTMEIQRAADASIPQTRHHYLPKIALPPEILAAIREKNRLRRKWMRNGDPQLRKEFRNLQNEIEQVVATWKDHNWKQKLTALRTEDDSLWKLARSLTNRNPRTKARLRATTTPHGNFSAEDFGRHRETVSHQMKTRILHLTANVQHTL
ncbi:hypothetical protein J437_LFUL006262 [Ladona fulva]|uniref:Endonuclease/exonuclease/phosphatase domain-containing protein n=1 Tax=Ladona fulva TaxID=123851 RepID=A0A8K0JYN0_LADFU|nr:hypothetical protein J437_LFUL006262 [Ladona fulva]